MSYPKIELLRVKGGANGRTRFPVGAEGKTHRGPSESRDRLEVGQENS